MPELHDGGVVCAWVFLWDEFGGPLPELFVACGGVDALTEVEESGEHAGDVSVDDRLWFIVGEGCDGACGVGSDAREGADFFEFPWECPVVVAGDGACGGVEVSRSSVVSESFPGFEDFLFGCFCHGAWVWVEGHEAGVVAFA